MDATGTILFLFDIFEFTRTRPISEPIIAADPEPPSLPTEPPAPPVFTEPEPAVPPLSGPPVEEAPEPEPAAPLLSGAPVEEATEPTSEEAGASEKRDLFGNSSTDFLDDMDREISELNLDDINVDDIDLEDESLFD